MADDPRDTLLEEPRLPDRKELVVIPARYSGYCSICRGPVGIGETIAWDRRTRAARHIRCEVET
jgi:hypothetical protein